MVKSINILAREFVSAMIDAAGNNKDKDDMNVMEEDLMRLKKDAAKMKEDLKYEEGTFHHFQNTS
eukprot:5563060-Ditylum_brightwellii.AAC.1